jgi:ornithine cyclodeaminase/alanine dehydrogenase-like protein (mu-crystallin family)
VAAALSGCDVCVTCTPARQPFLRREHVPAGAFVAAVGADHPDKQELDPELVAASTLVVDSLEQCAAFGELHHALAAGVVSRGARPAELHEVVSGRRPGRRSADEVVIFDSTGIAVEDVAAAALVYEQALETGCGTSIRLGD